MQFLLCSSLQCVFRTVVSCEPVMITLPAVSWLQLKPFSTPIHTHQLLLHSVSLNGWPVVFNAMICSYRGRCKFTPNCRFVLLVLDAWCGLFKMLFVLSECSLVLFSCWLGCNYLLGESDTQPWSGRYQLPHVLQAFLRSQVSGVTCPPGLLKVSSFLCLSKLTLCLGELSSWSRTREPRCCACMASVQAGVFWRSRSANGTLPYFSSLRWFCAGFNDLI